MHPFFITTIQVPHAPYLADLLSDTYDIYLEILRAEKASVLVELGRHNKNWDTQNICPPCLYQLENEAPLKFRFLATMDGNNSLKLIDSTYRAGSVRTDTRTCAPGRWISADDVDLFKDEVSRSERAQAVSCIDFVQHILMDCIEITFNDQ